MIVQIIAPQFRRPISTYIHILHSDLHLVSHNWHWSDSSLLEGDIISLLLCLLPQYTFIYQTVSSAFMSTQVLLYPAHFTMSMPPNS